MAFIVENWVDLALIIVGASAFITYFLQGRREKIDAASVLVLQIDELLEKIGEMSSYIVEGQLNNTAFYESLPLFEENYWNKYKHLFVKNMDAAEYSTLNKFYNYASEIQEQHQLMKNLQRNGFFQTQGAYTQLEVQSILRDLDTLNSLPNAQALSKAVSETVPSNISEENKKILDSMVQQVLTANPQFDMSQFWATYNRHRGQIYDVLNQGALTYYVPKQIGLSLEKSIQGAMNLGIAGRDGYRVLKKISKRKL